MRALAGSGASDLDDLVQVAAEQTFRKLPTFEGRSNLRTWVYAICYRVLLKHRRWYRRWSARFRLEDEGDLAAPDRDGPLPSAQLELRERARVLQAGLSRLSELQRAVVVLHDLEELEIAQVASIVDCNVLTARSRLRDARKQLRKWIEADPKFSWGERHGLESL
jgi:RNA polymerase sigma-70 factor (ECF subfamily)